MNLQKKILNSVAAIAMCAALIPGLSSSAAPSAVAANEDLARVCSGTSILFTIDGTGSFDNSPGKLEWDNMKNQVIDTIRALPRDGSIKVGIDIFGRVNGMYGLDLRPGHGGEKLVMPNNHYLPAEPLIDANIEEIVNTVKNYTQPESPVTDHNYDNGYFGWHHMMVKHKDYRAVHPDDVTNVVFDGTSGTNWEAALTHSDDYDITMLVTDGAPNVSNSWLRKGDPDFNHVFFANNGFTGNTNESKAYSPSRALEDAKARSQALKAKGKTVIPAIAYSTGPGGSKSIGVEINNNIKGIAQSGADGQIERDRDWFIITDEGASFSDMMNKTLKNRCELLPPRVRLVKGEGKEVADGRLQFDVTIAVTGNPADVTIEDLGGEGLTDVKVDYKRGARVDGTKASFDNLKGTKTVTFSAKPTYTGDGSYKNTAIVYGHGTGDNSVYEFEPPEVGRCYPNTNVWNDDDRCDYVTGRVAPRGNLKVDKTPGTFDKAKGKMKFTVSVKAIEGAMKNVQVADLGGQGIDPNTLEMQVTGDKGRVEGTGANAKLVIDELAQDEVAIATVWAGPVKGVATYKNVVTAKGVTKIGEAPRIPPTNPQQTCQTNDNVDADNDRCDAVTGSWPSSQLKVVKDKLGLDKAKGKFKFKVGVKAIGDVNNVVVDDLGGAGLDKASREVELITNDKDAVVSDGVINVPVLRDGEVVEAFVWMAPDASNAREYTNKVVTGGDSPFGVIPKGDPASCVANATVDADTDRCDVVSDKIPRGDLKVVKDKLNWDRAKGKYKFKVAVKAVNGDVTNVTVNDVAGVGLDKASREVELITKDKGATVADGVIRVPALAENDVVEAYVWLGLDDSDAAEYKNVVVTGGENPFGPVPSGNPEQCQANATIDADNDRCDVVSDPIPRGELKIVKSKPTIDVEKGKLKFPVTVKAVKGAMQNVKVTDLGGAMLNHDSIEAAVVTSGKGTVNEDGTITIPTLAKDESVDVVFWFSTEDIDPSVTFDNAPSYKNTVVTSGDRPNGPTLDAPSDPLNTCQLNNTVDADIDRCDAVTDSIPMPRIAIEKVGTTGVDNVTTSTGKGGNSIHEIPFFGDRSVTWLYKVSNTGTDYVRLNNVTDNVIGELTCETSLLAPGAKTTCTGLSLIHI